MNRIVIRGFICILIVAFIAGCTARTYSVRKDREDQQMTGNVGYVGGTPPPEAKDRTGDKMTRKTYVLEINTGSTKTQDARAEEIVREADEIAERAKRTSVPARTYQAGQPQPTRRVSTPLTEPAQPSFVEYTVQENDTLQKISMKFYNTNRKWSQIYEANKGIIKNPDRIKPGLMLRIPQ